jgi:hypothetical protein
MHLKQLRITARVAEAAQAHNLLFQVLNLLALLLVLLLNLLALLLVLQ